MLGGAALVILRELFGQSAGPAGPPPGVSPKLVALMRDLSTSNFNLTGLKTLIFQALVADGNSGAAATINWTTGAKHALTLTGNATITFTAPAGVSSLTLRLTQDSAGSRTVTWPANVKWAGASAPILSTAAGAIDIVSLLYDGSTYWGVAGLNFG